LTGSWPAVPDAVADLRRRVVSFACRAGAPAEALSSIRLAVSEAATNVVLHAYPDAPGEVRVSVKREGRALRVVVEDDGGGMTPRPDSPGLGLGLPLIAQLVDGLEVVRRVGGGTSLCMRFEI
jgi:serine/threonine-protein kinase RsbW/stage II sporulation protein AB (anti-sigma F factor)